MWILLITCCINQGLLNLGWTIHPFELPQLDRKVKIITENSYFPVFNAKSPFFHSYSTFYEKYRVPVSRNLFGYFQSCEHVGLLNIQKKLDPIPNKIGIHIRLKDSPYTDNIQGYLEEALPFLRSTNYLTIYSDDIRAAKNMLLNNTRAQEYSCGNSML